MSFAVPHVLKYKAAWPEYHYKAAALVCQRMKASLRHKKRNTLSQVLNSLLYEMQPSSSAELRVMPRIKVEIAWVDFENIFAAGDLRV